MYGYAADKDDYLKRLRRIEGQVRGLQRMVEEGRYCIDIPTQVSAATRPFTRSPSEHQHGDRRAGRVGRGEARHRGRELRFVLKPGPTVPSRSDGTQRVSVNLATRTALVELAAPMEAQSLAVAVESAGISGHCRPHLRLRRGGGR
jgi:hypothetical protein